LAHVLAHHLALLAGTSSTASCTATHTCRWVASRFRHGGQLDDAITRRGRQSRRRAESSKAGAMTNDAVYHQIRQRPDEQLRLASSADGFIQDDRRVLKSALAIASR
jgi:hypothetical protein